MMKDDLGWNQHWQ